MTGLIIKLTQDTLTGEKEEKKFIHRHGGLIEIGSKKLPKQWAFILFFFWNTEYICEELAGQGKLGVRCFISEESKQFGFGVVN